MLKSVQDEQGEDGQFFDRVPHERWSARQGRYIDLLTSTDCWDNRQGKYVAERLSTQRATSLPHHLQVRPGRRQELEDRADLAREGVAAVEVNLH